MYELVIVLDSHRCMMNITPPKKYSITRQNPKRKIHTGTILSKRWNYYFDYGCFVPICIGNLSFQQMRQNYTKKKTHGICYYLIREAFKVLFFFSPEQGFLSFNLLKNHLEILLKHNLHKLNTQSFWFRMESEHLHA